MNPNPHKILMGRFAKPYGVRGWIKILSYTHPIENLLIYSEWYIERNGSSECVEIENSKVHGKWLIVKLKAIDSPEAVHFYTNKSIFVRRDQLKMLPQSEYYWSDLIGLKVMNQEHMVLGHIESLFATGANDVIVVTDGNQQHLIPYLTTVVKSIDLENKILHVDWDTTHF